MIRNSINTIEECRVKNIELLIQQIRQRKIVKMPTSLFSEMDRGVNSGGSGSLEEQRALQLAFELSMLGLEGNPGCPVNGSGPGNNVINNDNDPLQSSPSNVFEEARSKKSQNMTECVPVPSSEHVAEIVGRQGNIHIYIYIHTFTQMKC